ncbi:MAG: aminopeptidase N [Betaproteobacteria bacterium]|nr:aminopeptidase N [Betaproteobacteria bacterium]
MNARDALGPTNTTPTVILRQDYRPPSHRLSSVSLDFTLSLDATRVVNEFSFERAGDSAALHLHGDELTLVSIAVDGRPLKSDEFEYSPQHLQIHQLPTQGTIRIETLVNPTANTALMGLYASRGGLFTQCESEGFRRITYFLDRPDVMAMYRVVMRGSKSEFPVLLSNGNLILQQDLPGGLHEAHWHDPFPKPSYLFALVAADLDYLEETITTRSGKQALLQVYTRREDLSQADFALQSLKRAIFWDEKRYGLELDLERFMIVAVPDFNSGAMENKGLNLFNTKFVLADPQTATDIDYDGIESVVAHEYFHNWTGNRITCRDWFQLTLKEGLTVFRDSEFSSDMAAEGLSPQAAASARAVRRIDSVRVLRAAQFPEDSGPMSHPIRPDSYQEIRNFYTATVYEKGAEVIRMLQTLLGVDGFRRGMDLYFARHDGQAVTCEEFVNAMFDANASTAPQPDERSRNHAAQFMRWYDTSGTPKVRVSELYQHQSGDQDQSGTYSLTFTQELAKTSPQQAPLMIPIDLGLLDVSGKSCPLSDASISGDAERHGNVLLLKGSQATLSIPCQSRPVPSLLRDFSAPISLEFDYNSSQLLHLLAHDPDSFNRWEAAQRLMLDAMLKPNSVDLSLMISAFSRIASDTTLDHGYKASLLSLPSELYISEKVSVIDPGLIRAARDQLREKLAAGMIEPLRRLDHELQAASSAPYSPDPLSTGRRLLANLVQHYLALVGAISTQELLARFMSVSNMTDRMALLSTLLEFDGPPTQEALDRYFHQFQHHDLALDKWFAAQVTIPNEQALAHVRALMHHPKFDVSNPNRVRSVFGAFFNQNLPGFHRQDGVAYELWAEAVLTIDRRNSQLASRMARALDRWSRFEPVRRTAMKAALERVAADGQLSPDVREVVGKALG